VEIAKRGRAAVTVVSNAFTSLGKAQARSLGHANLPLAVIPHPFGSRTREEVRALAEQCVEEIARLAAAK
jgi:predicted dienelactone hydrolase